jgi:hypothetical protein
MCHPLQRLLNLEVGQEMERRPLLALHKEEKWAQHINLKGYEWTRALIWTEALVTALNTCRKGPLHDIAVKQPTSQQRLDFSECKFAKITFAVYKYLSVEDRHFASFLGVIFVSDTLLQQVYMNYKGKEHTIPKITINKFSVIIHIIL